MKRYILLTAAIALLIVNVQAQNFKETLQKTFVTFDTSFNMQTKIEQSNKLSMIAKKWNTEWVTHYYASYGKVILSYNERDEAKRDAYLDEAEKEKDEAVSILTKENDETYVLNAMIANARMAVNPMNRWQKYGKIFTDNLDKAKAANPDNPRIYYIQGTSKFYTPKAFGGGKKAAMPYFEKANGLFAKESDADITKPSWGKTANTYFFEQCKIED
ncbi:MAG: hypothetical protein WCG87_00560 [Bacteroidota bacterium]